MKLISRQSGAGLVAVLVGIAIMGILAVVLTNYLSVAVKLSYELNEKDNIEALRRSFRVKLNCPATVDAIASCTAGSPTALRRAGNRLFIKAPNGASYTKSGKYYLMASCAGNYTSTTAVLRFDVRYSKDKSSWSDLFDFPVVCQRN